MNSSSPLKSVTLYYDGLCVVCSREIAHYQRMRGAEAIDFVDIAAPDFDAATHGLDAREVNRVLHARDAEGALHLGVDAFILIWSHLPALRWLARLAKRRPVRALLQVGYDAFVRVRPWLPRRSCDNGHCALPTA